MKTVKIKMPRESFDLGRLLVARSGKLTFKGSRIRVRTVLTCLAKGMTVRKILAAWPSLKPRALRDALDFAAAALVERSGARPWRTDEPVDAEQDWERFLKALRRKQPVPVGKHLIVHPRVCFGRLTFDGTRMPVEVVLTYLGMGKSIQYILKGWPELTREAIVEAIEMARDALEERVTANAGIMDESAHSGRSA